MNAADFCLASAGGFFLTGLISGIWKYGHTWTQPDARAHTYVDVAHRSALMYSFACALLAQLVVRSAWQDSTNFAAALALIVFFALALSTYLIHGILRDTDNQLKRPHRLGKGTIPSGFILSFMLLLILAEVGGFVVILSGFITARL